MDRATRDPEPEDETQRILSELGVLDRIAAACRDATAHDDRPAPRRKKDQRDERESRLTSFESAHEKLGEATCACGRERTSILKGRDGPIWAPHKVPGTRKFCERSQRRAPRPRGA